jgi:phosphomannomutase
MEINLNIFRAYDIRGVYPSELNEETAYLLGRAFPVFLRKKEKKKLNIVVGRDNRLSSEKLYKSLVRGIRESGADAIDIGLSTTPLTYFSVGYYGFDGGIQITASHNPGRYNGFKIVRAKALPVSKDSGLMDLKNVMRKAKEGNVAVPPRKGSLKKINPLLKYVAFNLKGMRLKSKDSLKIAVDTANAVPGKVVPEFLEKISCKPIYLFKKLDGRFPNHEPDPLIRKNLASLCREVKRKKADLGVAFDGDGDRIMFVDEKGSIIPADHISSLMSRILLEKNPGQKIFYDIRSSNIVKETIKEAGGIPIMGKVGHTFIKKSMRLQGILFAGELSGHYYHRDHFFAECPLLVLRKVIERLQKEKKTMSELMDPFNKYFHSGEINFKVKNKEKALKAIEKKYKKGKLSYIDGIRCDFEDWWFSSRLSNTEPFLRLVIEASTKKLLKEKGEELKKLIGGK